MKTKPFKVCTSFFLVMRLAVVSTATRAKPLRNTIIDHSNSGVETTRHWDVARELRDATPNSYAKKFSSIIEAEKYIRDFNFKIVSNGENSNESSNVAVKRKRTSPIRSIENSISSPQDHIKKIKKAFDDLQKSLSLFPRLPETCSTQVKMLNEDVCNKLNAIFDETNTSFLLENQAFIVNQDDTDKSNVDVNSMQLSQIEEAKKSFLFNGKNEVIVYTDGACSNNGHNKASAGIGIWFGKGHLLNLSMKLPGKQTNNNAEIFAIIKAIERVKATGLTKVDVHTDSGFVIKSINEWLPRWQSNGWKTSSGAAVKNKEMFEKLFEVVKIMDSVNWTYVPGHKGIVGNEEADRLARLGAQM